jgi:ABC-type dipeptide/oligopeptide/nickel transport system permease component
MLLTFLLRRLLLAVAVLFTVSFASFCFLASAYLPLRDTPLLPAYWHWLRGVPSGRSLAHGLFGPLLPVVVPAVGHTLALLAMTLVLVVVLSVLLGCLAAACRGSALDMVLRTCSYLAWAVPAFLLALVLQQAVGKVAGGTGLGLFPAAGWAGNCPGGLGIDLRTFRCPAAGTGLDYLRNVLWHLGLPAIALATGFIGLHSRYLRSSLVGVLNAPYVTTARAKGVPERKVIVRHALRNSLITFVPALLTDFGAIFGASLAVDWVFRLDGLGTLFISVLNVNSTSPVLDTYAMQVLLLLGCALVLTASLLGELAVALLDPRVNVD